MRTAALLLAVALGCSRRDPAAIRPTDEHRPPERVEPSELPRVRTLADIAEHHGKRVVVEGRYEVDRLSGMGKGHHLTWIVLVDGTHISRAYGAIERELGFVERRVLATGVITSGPPDDKMQALLAPHLAVETIVAAPGETVLETRDIPEPPTVSTMPQLGARIDRWVQVIATLTAIAPDDTASLRLSDGGVVRVLHVARAQWSPHLGKLVTVNGQLSAEKGSATFALDLVMRGRAAICAGVVARCGM